LIEELNFDEMMRRYNDDNLLWSHNTDLQKKGFWLLLNSWGSFPKRFSA